MVGFRKFMAIWLAVVVGGSALVGGWAALFRSPNAITETQEVEENHFSVRWMGFAPSYSSQYPAYYVTINNLKQNNLTMNIALQIKNQEDKGYYFKVERHEVPPAGWALSNMSLGLIDKDATRTLTYQAYRARPTTISEGRLAENINVAVKAYHDAGYSLFYSQDNFTVTFHLIDRTSGVWTTLYNDNFDDGTTQQWSYWPGGSYTTVAVSNTYYRSFQYSLKLSTYDLEQSYKKSFTIPQGYGEAYLVFSARIVPYGSWDGFRIALDGVTYFRPDVAVSYNVWYQFTVPLPSGKTTSAEIWSTYGSTPVLYQGIAYLDDVYVIAK